MENMRREYNHPNKRTGLYRLNIGDLKSQSLYYKKLKTICPSE